MDAEVPSLGFSAKAPPGVAPIPAYIPLPAPVPVTSAIFGLPSPKAKQKQPYGVIAFLVATLLFVLFMVHLGDDPATKSSPAAPSPSPGVSAAFHPPVVHAPAYVPQTLTAADIEGKSPSDLSIMRNQIYARHGYIFRRKSLASYFSGQAWYHPKTHSESAALASMTGVERRNLALLTSTRVSKPNIADDGDRTTKGDSVSASALTPEEQNYLITMRSHANRMGDCINTFSALCEEHDFENSDWVLRMATNLVDMKHLAVEGKGYDAPPRFADMKTSYDAAMSDYEYVATTMPDAIGSRDVGMMKDCLSKCNDALENIHQATYKIRHIPGVPVN